MKKPCKTRLVKRKNRLKRPEGNISREVFKVLSLFSAVIAITAVMIFGCNYIISSPYFRIKETIVRGCKELTEKDILVLAAIKPSHNILTINIAAVKRKISANPWVRNVCVGREFPDRLVIEIRERIPVALIRKDNNLYLMDVEGVSFKALNTGDEADFPVLTGSADGKEMNPELIKKSLKLLRYLATSREFLSVEHVSEVHGSEISGLSLFTSDGMNLQLGFDNYENKLKRLIPVIADLERKEIKRGFLHIDLSDPVRVTVHRGNIKSPQESLEKEKGYST